MLKRVMGKASFATIQDLSGRIQIFVSNDKTGEAAHAEFKRWDNGDIIGVVGTLFRTKTNELTIEAQRDPPADQVAASRCPRSSTGSPTSSRSTAPATST
jgi:lysyl-tRNA synthetase class II